ncbi:MAG: hypothetical protein WBM54_12295 [Woeseia sp.]
MKSTSILVLAAASATCITLAGCASSKPDPRKQELQFDLDGDGYLTREEYSASALSDVLEFEALDTDRDGLLSRRELELRIGPGSRGRGPRDGKRPGGG